MSIPRKLLLPLAGGLLLAGCSPEFASVEITPITDPPLDVVLSSAKVELPVGIAVAVNVTGLDDEGDPVDQISCTPPGSLTAGVIETAQPDQFIFYGMSHGSGSLTFTAVSIDGTVVVPVSIVPQH